MKKIKKANDLEGMTLVQAVRFAITTEYDAVNVYEKVAEMATDSDMEQLFLDIAREEKVHIGELEALLSDLDDESKEALSDGSDEKEEIIAKRIAMCLLSRNK